MWVVFICENFHNLTCYVQKINVARMRTAGGPQCWASQNWLQRTACLENFHVDKCSTACYDVGNSEKEAL